MIINSYHCTLRTYEDVTASNVFERLGGNKKKNKKKIIGCRYIHLLFTIHCSISQSSTPHSLHWESISSTLIFVTLDKSLALEDATR